VWNWEEDWKDNVRWIKKRKRRRNDGRFKWRRENGMGSRKKGIFIKGGE
jgi:hypothetical protein